MNLIGETNFAAVVKDHAKLCFACCTSVNCFQYLRTWNSQKKDRIFLRQLNRLNQMSQIYQNEEKPIPKLLYALRLHFKIFGW